MTFEWVLFHEDDTDGKIWEARVFGLCLTVVDEGADAGPEAESITWDVSEGDEIRSLAQGAVWSKDADHAKRRCEHVAMVIAAEKEGEQ